MGISYSAANLLLASRAALAPEGEALQLGRQSLFEGQARRARLLRRHRIDEPVAPETLDGSAFFRLLGYQGVTSLDVSDYEGADLIHDLNLPVPDAWRGRFNFIFDGGAFEHIFDFPQALANCHDMLKDDGVIIHVSPSSNHVDHGFYMFSPTAYWDYYSANGYEIIQFYIFEYSIDFNKPWKFYSYVPGVVDHKGFGGWGGAMLGVWCAVRRRKTSTSGVVPQQGFYTRLAQGAGKRAPPAGLDWVVKRAFGHYPEPYASWREPYFTLRRHLRRMGKPPRVHFD